MKAFWQGHVPLPRAFWRFAILYLGLLNFTATFAAMAAVAADLPALAVVVFLLPVPFALIAVVGVWRSAQRYRGDPQWARLARGAVVAWAVVTILC